MQQVLLNFRVLEFVVAIVLLIAAYALSIAHVHQRPIPYIQVRLNATEYVYARDPSIDYEKKHEQVTHVASLCICLAVPIGTHLLVNGLAPLVSSNYYALKRIPYDTRDFLLSLLVSIGISTFFTQFLKTFGGRLRPCFHHMCQWRFDEVWDGKSDLCTSEKWEKEARKSFPSGHTSFGFATLFLLTLYLLGRSRVVHVQRHESHYVGACSMFKLFVCLLPTFLASWIGVTRAMDNWHNFSDVMAGAVVGILAAAAGYSYNYNSVFHPEHAGLPLQTSFAAKKDLPQPGMLPTHITSDAYTGTEEIGNASALELNQVRLRPTP